MPKVKYTICRDNIFVGEVAKITSIYRYEESDNSFGVKNGQLTTGSWLNYRSMLFNPTLKNLLMTCFMIHQIIQFLILQMMKFV